MGVVGGVLDVVLDGADDDDPEVGIRPEGCLVAPTPDPNNPSPCFFLNADTSGSHG